jgi:hypothetical protein
VMIVSMRNVCAVAAKTDKKKRSVVSFFMFYG